MLVPFYPVSLHHQKKTNNIQRRIKQKTKEESNENERRIKTTHKDEKKNRTYAV